TEGSSMADTTDGVSGGKLVQLPHGFTGQVRLVAPKDEFERYDFCLLNGAGQVLRSVQLPMCPNYYSIHDVDVVARAELRLLIIRASMDFDDWHGESLTLCVLSEGGDLTVLYSRCEDTLARWSGIGFTWGETSLKLVWPGGANHPSEEVVSLPSVQRAA